ncbi:MAG: hypothetical protein EZS28_033974, partial [Streblomastix strix]
SVLQLQGNALWDPTLADILQGRKESKLGQPEADNSETYLYFYQMRLRLQDQQRIRGNGPSGNGSQQKRKK